MLQVVYLKLESIVLMVVFVTVLCPTSEFLKQDLKGKHSWLNASSAKDLAKRVRHVLSACVLDPLSTYVCVLTRQSMPIDMSLLRDFHCILTVPKGGLVC
jgi:hypothetical protein